MMGTVNGEGLAHGWEDMVKSDLVKCALGLRPEKNRKRIETTRDSGKGSKGLNGLNGLRKLKKNSNISLHWIKLEIRLQRVAPCSLVYWSMSSRRTSRIYKLLVFPP